VWLTAPPGQAGLVDTLQSTFVTTGTRVVVTAGALLVLAGAALAIRAAGPRLAGRLGDDDVEAIQSVAFTVVAVLTAGLLLAVWEAVDALPFTGLELGPRQGALALVGGLVLVIAFTVTRISKGLAETAGGSVLDRHRRHAVHHVVQIVVYILAALVVLALAGVPPGNLLVGAGAAGIVLGLAARQTLGAVLAGFVVLFARPFEIGDWVVVDDREGVVCDLSLFNTELRTPDGERVVVPNDAVTASDIVNRSREGRLRVSVDVGVDYGTDLDSAVELARDAMTGIDILLDEPSPAVVLKRFGDSAVVLELRFWIGDPTARKRWAAQTAVVGAVKGAFDDADVKIPFPQRELSGRPGDDGPAAVGEAVETDAVSPPEGGND